MKSPDVFVAGYGSLRNHASRALILHHVDGQPVLIQGLTPTFNARMTFPVPNPKRTPGETALGFVNAPSGILEATLIPVKPLQLEKLDIRETEASERVQVPIETIIFNSHKPEREITVWIYKPKAPQFPSLEFPLNQSYVDVVLGGYYEAGETSVVTRFVQAATGWGDHWVNDREEPQYPRALNYLDPETKKLVYIVDKVLWKNQRDAMQHRVDINTL